MSNRFCILCAVILMFASSAQGEITHPVTITGTDVALSNYQVKVPITWLDGMRHDFGDVRFYDTDNVTALNYWIEVVSQGVSAIGWVKIPTLASNTTRTIYMRYAQGQTTTTGNGTNTFAFFDDFSGTGNTSWPLMGRTGDYTRIYNAAFGCLLVDTSGRTVIDGSGNGYIYFTRTGGWVAIINYDTLTVGATNRAKNLDADSGWASPHVVVKVAEDFYIMAYSAQVSGVGQSTRLATNSTPDGVFTRVSGLDIVGSTGWEMSGSSSWLESGMRFLRESEDANTLIFWIGIENAGTWRMGWSKVSYNKTTGAFTEVERYSGNPLSTLVFTGFEAAYGGGNLDQTGLNIGTTNMMIYESRDGAQDFMSIALSANPLFDTVSTKYHADMPWREETEIEKFQYLVRSNKMLVFYQLQSPDASKGTICRQYVAGEFPDSTRWTRESAATVRVAGGNLVSTITASVSAYTDTLSTSTYGANKILRFKIRSQTTNKVEQIGFRSGAGSGAGAVIQFGSDGFFRLVSHNGITSTGTNVMSYADYDWHTIELVRTTTNALVNIDGTFVELTSTLSTSAQPILLAGYNGAPGAATERDFIFVREYAIPEPTVLIGESGGEPSGGGNGLRVNRNAIRLLPSAIRIQ